MQPTSASADANRYTAASAGIVLKAMPSSAGCIAPFGPKNPELDSNVKGLEPNPVPLTMVAQILVSAVWREIKVGIDFYTLNMDHVWIESHVDNAARQFIKR